MENKIKTYKLITTKMIFSISLVIFCLTILFVWFFGLGQHRALYENSIISTSLLSLTLFIFLFIGLYNGFKLKDNIGKIKRNYSYEKIETNDTPIVIAPIESLFEAIIYFIFSIGFFITLLSNIVTFIWMGVLVFVAMLYWVFYRAVKVVFKKSNICKNNFLKSLIYSCLFTVSYAVWFYLIIYGLNYLI